MASKGKSRGGSEQNELSNLRQMFYALIANFTIVSPGMNLGYSAVAIPALSDVNKSLYLNTDQASWFASIASIATPIGCLLCGPILDKKGRMFSLYFTNVTMIIGWIVIAFADQIDIFDSYTLLLIGRFITGMGMGLSSVPTTVYVSEISTPTMRSMLTTWTSVTFALGVLIIYTLGFFFPSNWKLLAIISALVAFLTIIGIAIFLPESPIWLEKRNEKKKHESDSLLNTEQKGYNSISFSSGIRNRNTGSQDIRRTSNSNDTICIRRITRNISEKLSYFTEPHYIKPLLIMSMFFLFQQFSGIMIMIYYSVDIVLEAGIMIDPYIMIVLIGFIRVLAAMSVGNISKRYGRRIPSIGSGIGMTICMAVLVAYLYFLNTTSQNNDACEVIDGQFGNVTTTELYQTTTLSTTTIADSIDDINNISINNYKWIPVVTILLYFLTSTVGFLAIPFAMVGEIYPTRVRGLFGGITTCAGYSFSFIIIKIYPQMLCIMGKIGLFMFYGAVSFIGTLFVLAFLPETKGKTLIEIEKLFDKKSIYDLDDNEPFNTELSERNPMLHQSKKTVVQICHITTK